jgi:hypothetical protein
MKLAIDCTHRPHEQNALVSRHCLEYMIESSTGSFGQVRKDEGVVSQVDRGACRITHSVFENGFIQPFIPTIPG